MKKTVFVVIGFHQQPSCYSRPRIIGVYWKKDQAKKALSVFTSKFHDTILYKEYSIIEHSLDNCSQKNFHTSTEKKGQEMDILYHVLCEKEYDDGCEDVLDLGVFNEECKAFETLLETAAKDYCNNDFIEYSSIYPYKLGMLSWEEGYFTS